ncbi:MAG: hypothetical protein KTR18_05175 [Acidiferrobacterales bacterium]|nr:hypothetical protein [Acidiferrobacterales bacterium]
MFELAKEPMGYLVEPITLELWNRLEQSITPNSHWYWFDFNCNREKIDFDAVELGSLFELSFPCDVKHRFDGIVLNLQLGWANYEQTFRHCLKWLKPGGQLFFSTFGPDTLFELREAWREVDSYPHVHDFPDLHALGDQLSNIGFEKPILDTDWQGVEFEDIDLLMSDLHDQGFNNLHQQRRKTLTGKQRLSDLRKQFSGQQTVQMTFEIIYGYARVPTGVQGAVHVNVPSLKS